MLFILVVIYIVFISLGLPDSLFGAAWPVVHKDFTIQDRMSKWGVHDHIVFSRSSHEIRQRYTQYPDNHYLDIILTLSSHEPFEVPFTSDFSHAYLNSVAYTDSCLGAFVDSLKQHPLWNSTIVILSSDHGYPYPNGITNYNPMRYRIHHMQYSSYRPASGGLQT